MLEEETLHIGKRCLSKFNAISQHLVVLLLLLIKLGELSYVSQVNISKPHRLKHLCTTSLYQRVVLFESADRLILEIEVSNQAYH